MADGGQETSDGQKAIQRAEEIVGDAKRESFVQSLRDQGILIKHPLADQMTKFLADAAEGSNYLSEIKQMCTPADQGVITDYENLTPEERLTVREAVYFGDLIMDATFRRFFRSRKMAERGRIIQEVVREYYDPNDQAADDLVHFGPDDKGWEQLIFKGRQIAFSSHSPLYYVFAAEDRQRNIRSLDDLQFLIIEEGDVSREMSQQAQGVIQKYSVEQLRGMDPGYLMTIAGAINYFGTRQQRDFWGQYYWSGFGQISRDARSQGTADETWEGMEKEARQIARSIEPNLDHIPTTHELGDQLEAQGLEEEKANDLSFIPEVQEEIIRIIIAPALELLRRNNARSDEQIIAALRQNPKIREEDMDSILYGTRLHLISGDADSIIAEAGQKGSELNVEQLTEELKKKGYTGGFERMDTFLDFKLALAADKKKQQEP